MPTVRLAVAVAGGSILWALGLTPFAWVYNVTLILVALWEAIIVYQLRRRLKIEREIDDVLEIGVDSKVTLILSNPTVVAMRVAVKDNPPSDFQWMVQGKGANWLRPFLRFSVPAHHQVKVSYTVTPIRRGEFHFGQIYLQVSTFLGLIQLQMCIALPQMVQVLPELSQARKYDLIMRKMRLKEFGFRPIPLIGAGMEFSSLRDYLPDDDPRWIDWNATARRNKVVSKEFELERGQNIVAVLDAGRVMATKLNGLTKLDHAVNAAAFLLYLANRLNDRIGLMAFSDRVKRLLLPRRGIHQWNAVLQTLRQIEPDLVESNYSDAFTRLLQKLPRRSLIVLFTDLIDPDTSEALLVYTNLLARKHLVFVAALSDYELRKILAQVPQEITDAYRNAAAVTILSDRLHAIAHLRDGGITVLDTTPQTLFSALVEHYLLAKRRI